jgi:hypothetical protein
MAKIKIYLFRVLGLATSLIWTALFSTYSLSETSEQSIWDNHQASSYWTPVASPSAVLQKNSQNVSMQNGIEVSLNLPQIQKLLPSSNKRGRTEVIIYFPNLHGEMIAFAVKEKSNFSPVLAAKFPEINAYVGVAVDDPGQKIHFSAAPSGLEAVISSNTSGRVNIEKIKGTSNYRISDNHEGHHDHGSFTCSTQFKAQSNDFKDLLTNAKMSPAIVKKSSFSNASTLSKYRLAVSANGQYTQYHGGTIAGALAGINATMTNVNAIYERDFGITLQLIDNNDSIIYTDIATDPYTDSTNSMNSELQRNLDDVIGIDNYDHGHLFSSITGFGMSGNAGAIGGFCNDQTKGSAWSDSARPEGSDFTFLVAHEMGHQIGANHTFSMRSEGTGKNVEPGSGTTVMSYAGITGGNDVAIASDNYFHHVSIEQSLNYLQSQSCHVDESNENSLPVIDDIRDVSIPILTPFILTGIAIDADQNDVLSYTWEQIDNGTVGFYDFGPLQQTGATFRSLRPSGTGVRYMPKLSSVLSGNLTVENPDVDSSWETLSAVPRDLNFGFTVRDNAVGGGGVTLAKKKVSVVDNGGAFVITSPASGRTYLAGSSHTVTWNVAGTNQAPINANTVTITLSVDGGSTYPYTLAKNAANTGSYEVSLPDFVTAKARVRIEPDNNIFYAINDQNISLTRKGIILSTDTSDYSVCSESSVTASLVYGTSPNYIDTAILSASNLPSDLSVVFSPSSVRNNNTDIDATISASRSIIPGIYSIGLHATSASRSQSLELNVQAYSAIFSPTALLTPLDGSTTDMLSTTVSWKADSNAEHYQVELSADQNFSRVLQSAEISKTSYTLLNLSSNTTYYWRVIPKNRCDNGLSSTVFSFTTPNNYTEAQDLPLAIPSDRSGGVYTSVIEIEENQRITDVNVLIDISMEDISQLNITLTSPSGTVVELFDRGCRSGQDMRLVFDDQADIFRCGENGTMPNLSGRQRPEFDLLSRFNEQSTQGIWTLTVSDECCDNTMENSINTFALEITSDAGVTYENYPPIAFGQTHSSIAGQETVVSLEGSDPEGSPLIYRLTGAANGNLKGISPRQLGVLAEPGNFCGVSDLLLVKEETIGIAVGNCRISVLDIRDPSSVTVLAEIELSFPGIDSVPTGVVSSDETLLFVAADWWGLIIYDISEPENITPIGAYDGGGTALGLALSLDEKTVFVANREGYQVQILDVTDPTNPSLLSTYDTFDLAKDVALSPDGKTLHIADSSILINLDVSDPANPEELGYSWLPHCASLDNFVCGEPNSLVLSADGAIAYVESTKYGLVIADVSDLSSPKIISNLDLGTRQWAQGASKVALSPDGTTIYLGANELGLMIIDVRDPSKPVLMNTPETKGTSVGVTVSDSGDKIYLSSNYPTYFGADCDGCAGLAIYNIEKEVLTAGDTVNSNIYYTGASDSLDTDSFTFVVNDGFLDSNLATVALRLADSVDSNERWRYTTNEEGTLTILGCIAACPSRLIIPDMINDVEVTAIAAYAFVSSGITEVVLPATLTHIGDYSFYDNELTAVTVGANVTDIAVGAFSYNTIEVISFLGHRPVIGVDAFKLNREFSSITYCVNTNGWPGNDISNELISISPTPLCDAATSHHAAIVSIGVAAANGDASGLSLDDFTALVGVSGLNQVYLDQYLTFVSNTSTQITKASDVQYIISSVNETMSSCPSSAYFVSVAGSNNWPWEISWDLVKIDNPNYPILSGDASHLSFMCLDSARYTLNMYDSYGDGWIDKNQVVDTFFTIWSSEGGDALVREGLSSGFYNTAAINLGDYPNAIPVANNQNVEVIRGVPKRISLTGVDGDLDPLTRRLVEAPSSGSLYRGLSFETISTYYNKSYIGGLALSGSGNDDIVYLAAGASGLTILDTSDKLSTNPTRVSNLDTDGWTRSVYLSNDDRTAFLADGTPGLKIVNVSDVSNPELVSQLKIGESVYDIALSNGGDVLYAAHLSGVSAVNISDLSNPFIISTIITPGDAQAIRLSRDGALVYIADGYEGFHIIDVSQPSSLKLLKSMNTPGEIYSLSLSANGALLYLADGSYGFKVFDLKYPTEPTLIASLGDIGFVSSVEVSQDGFFVYLATDRVGPPVVVNVTDSQNPTLVSSSSDYERVIQYAMPSPDGQKAYVIADHQFYILNLGYVDPMANGNNLGDSIVYLTDSDNSETDIFEFVVNDGLLDSDVAQIAINILSDSDGDQVPDRDDAFPNNAAESVDTDGDGIGNNADDDDDNDGVSDLLDTFPLISLNGLRDTDGDGIPDSCANDCRDIGMTADQDDDNDGVSDENDAFPLNFSESLDSDSDGIGNNVDTDDDGDGVIDSNDAYPLISLNGLTDTDLDGRPNDCDAACLDAGMTADTDDDGDGVSDNDDAFPLDSSETADTDLDGVGDNSDLFPNDALYSIDSDSDGMPDEWETRYGLNPNDASDAASDQDNDGVTALDEFLAGTIPSGSLDIDGNENYDALTDGLLLLRGMFGLDGSALVTGTIASDAAYTESVDIESRIEALGELADIDGNGQIDALTDGLLTLRYLFGLQGDTLINGVVADDATRTTAEEIEAHLETLMPAL